MESQDYQSPSKVWFWRRLWEVVRKNKDDSVRELPLSLRFIIKSAALLAHQKHLKPTSGYEFFILIPLPVLQFVHGIIGVFLFVMFVRVNIAAVLWWWNKIKNIINDMRSEIRGRR